MRARLSSVIGAVILLVSEAGHAASGGPVPRLKPTPVDFVVSIGDEATGTPATRSVYPAATGTPVPGAQPLGSINPAAPLLVLQPISYSVPSETVPTAASYTVTQTAPLYSNQYRPPVISLSNQKTDLHELVLRSDVTTAINFQGAERIRTVLMGRAEEFFVDTPKSRQTISVRPKSARSTSNITVVTNRDIYHFDLRSVSQASDVQPVYGVVVEDSEETKRSKQNSLADVENLNFSYTFRGSNDLRPLRLFDDGKHTYFQFPDHTATPAIFSVSEGGTESIVNQHVKGNYLVVESLGRQFTLRRGATHTCIYNKAYPEPHFDDGAPQPEGGPT